MDHDDFFGAGSPYLTHPLLTQERTRSEVDGLEDLLDLPTGATVVDIGCGFGRHSIELSLRGHDVLGIDPSLAMIAAARNDAVAAGTSVRFEICRGEDFVSADPFDAVICLFTTFGQMGPSGDNSTVLVRALGLLKSGGRVAVEIPQRDAYLDSLNPSDRFGSEDRSTEVSREFDTRTGVLSEQFRVVSDNSERSFNLRYRLYSAEELGGLLRAAGFIEIDFFGDYSGSPLRAEDTHLLAVGTK